MIVLLVAMISFFCSKRSELLSQNLIGDGSPQFNNQTIRPRFANMTFKPLRERDARPILHLRDSNQSFIRRQ